MFRSVQRVGLALSLSLVLFGCGKAPDSSPTAGMTTDPYADGQQSPWEYHADTALLPQSLTPGINTLQYERILYARNGWGPVEKNRSNGEQTAGDGQTLSINHFRFAQGYGVHANSELRFSLVGTNGAQCTRFTSYFGLDDEVRYRNDSPHWPGWGSVAFQVFLDGVKVYEGYDGRGNYFSVPFVNLNIANKKELRLVVTDAGDGAYFDHADWADPKISCQRPEAPGSLDFAFGQGGEVSTDFTSEDDFARSVAIDGQNRVLVVGTINVPHSGSTSPDKRSVILARYLPDGTLDQSFGVGGKVVTRARNVAVDSRGRVVVTGGGSQADYGGVVFVERYTANGTLDMSFGSGGRVEWRDGYDGVALNIDSKDRIVVMTNTMTIARFTTSGAFDSSFGQGGEVDTQFHHDGGGAYHFSDTGSVAIDAQDRIVVGGKGYDASSEVFELARYTTDGLPDQSFGQNGRVITDVTPPPGNPANTSVIALAITPQEGIVAAANTGIVRYTESGTLDPSFGSGGRVTSVGASSIALDAAGRLVTATFFLEGTGRWVHTGARLHPDGSLDASFGLGGRIEPRLAVHDVAIDSGGRIVFVGSTKATGSESTPSALALARYLP